MSYKRGDVVILPFPFVTTSGTQQKARPALIISDHSIRRRFDDLILAGITSQRIDDIMETEFLIDEQSAYFGKSGLKKSSVVRGEYLMTIPKSLVSTNCLTCLSPSHRSLDIFFELEGHLCDEVETPRDQQETNW